MNANGCSSVAKKPGFLLFKYGQVHFSPQEAAAYYANAACQVDDKELVTVEVIVDDAQLVHN